MGKNGHADAEWFASVTPQGLTASRHDDGVLVAMDLHTARATTTMGVRVERSATSYRVRSDSAPQPEWRLSSRTTSSVIGSLCHQSTSNAFDAGVP